MLTVLLLANLLVSASGVDCQLVDYSFQGKSAKALICQPEGPGPFPVVIYNHGAIVDFRGYDGAKKVGYDLDGICRQLADDGFLTVAPIRQSGRGRMASHAAEIQRAIAYVKTLPQADTTWMALMGFSRGGALTLIVSLQQPEIHTVVLEAPALRPDRVEGFFTHTDTLEASYLLLIEKSDNAGFIQSLARLDTLLADRGARVQRVLYDRGGGHRLFWKVDYYWDEVRAFLRERLQSERQKAQ